MNLRVQKIVEFNKITEKISEMAVCSQTRVHVLRMKPTSNEDLCTKWLDETESAVLYLLKRGEIPLRPVKSVDQSLQIAKIGGTIYHKELLLIKDLLHVSRGIKEHMVKYDNKQNDEKTFIETLISDLYCNKHLEEKIGLIILSEEEIADDASSELRSIRRSIIREQDSIKSKLDSIIRSASMSKYLQESIVTMRQGRYVIPVRAEYKSEVKGFIHDTSSSGQTYFIEPISVLDSNNRIKELLKEEDIEIEKILQLLSNEVGEVADNIKQVTSCIFKLDFCFAKAAYALEINAIRPKINRSGYINIIKGRHPLISKDDVVSIDFKMGDKYKAVVVTGPNTGGKTVTLKTIGLLTLMTQAGIFIPASTGSEMSIFKEVFADIGDEQSIEQSLSTFSSHMKNIVHILKRAKRSHLVLFDELGAGTDPVEGAALAMSILENLRSRKITCIATTHYSELKMYALNTSGVVNASCEFDIETLRPTFRLLIGVPGKSNAFEISWKLGLNNTVIDKARSYISKKDMNFEATITQLQEYRRELEKDKELAKKYREEAEFLKQKFESVKLELDEKKHAMIDAAKREAYNLADQAKKEINSLIDMAKSATSTQEKIAINSKINILLNNNSDSVFDNSIFKKEDLNRTLKKGDFVFSKRLNSEAQIISDPDENDEVFLVAGALKIKLKTDELNYLDKTQVMKENKSGRRIVSKSIEIKTEIDLRGENIENALVRLDKYLDDVYLSGLHQVVVIHGKGTGVLREGVNDFLKSHHHVKTQRSGQYGEGDSGVTVVTLK